MSPDIITSQANGLRECRFCHHIHAPRANKFGCEQAPVVQLEQFLRDRESGMGWHELALKYGGDRASVRRLARDIRTKNSGS
jgi:hypothetical protein